MWASATVLAWARNQVLQNSGSQMVVLRFTTLSARDRHWRNPRKKEKKSAQQYKKLACQCTYRFSATQNGCGATERFSTHQESNPCRPSHCNLPLSHWFVSIAGKKRYMTRRISIPATNFFCVQDCRTWIFQVEYQGQTRYTRILEGKPLIDTSYRIRHRWSWNIFTSYNFCSMLIEQLINLEKVRTDNLKFRTIFEIELWMVGQ